MTDKDFQEFMIEHMTKLTNVLTDLRLSTARMEFGITGKINILSDGQEAIKGTLKDHTERLQRIENKVEKHDIQIQVLDKTKSNKRQVK
ncbi:MAG: hypothetical protein GX808_14270 [Syntrophomonadaceae bacterium]|jgi:hypothetical protein|nr:hypothetical protein [Syntrophomonadaceae bacterium]